MTRGFVGHTFERIDAIEPERESSGAVREFMPQSRYRNARGLPLNRYGAGPFCRFSIARAIVGRGVYVLTLAGQPVPNVNYGIIPLTQGADPRIVARGGIGHGSIEDLSVYFRTLPVLACSIMETVAHDSRYSIRCLGNYWIHQS